MQTQINLAAFVGDLARPGKNPDNSNGLVLGTSFTKDEEIMKIISILAGKYSNGKPVNETEISIKDPILSFYVFTLLCHQYLTNSEMCLSTAIEKRLNNLAILLSVSKEDQEALIAFLQNELPYSDRTRAVYLNADKKASSVKYIGVNIIHTSGKSNEILYLKYFEKYNLFLSKTFIETKNPYHFLETINSTEINIVQPSNYLMDNFAYYAFEELVSSVKNHHPFQYFELEATANTPRIILDPREGKAIISGSSSPFSPSNFFEPILEWFQNYSVLGQGDLRIFIMLDYFNTYTSKFLLNLCRRCDNMVKEGKQVKIFWYFDPEDVDMREFGEHLGSIFKEGFEYCLISDGLEELV